jgi:hypothetical protein
LTGSLANESVAALSDANIFLRCCFATAMGAINEITLPVSVIDSLPFDRIKTVRRALANQGFQQKYDAILSEFLSLLASGKVLEDWKDPQKTVKIAEELATHFRRYIAYELPNYKKLVQERHQQEAIQAGAETAKNALGFIPGIGELMTVYDTTKSAFGFVEHEAKGLMTRDLAVADRHARREREEKQEEALEALAPSNKATILTALRQLRLIASHEIAPN